MKPGKVVAGQEPERTNEFLQAVARMLDSGVDHDDRPDLGSASALRGPAEPEVGHEDAGDHEDDTADEVAMAASQQFEHSCSFDDWFGPWIGSRSRRMGSDAPHAASGGA